MPCQVAPLAARRLLPEARCGATHLRKYTRRMPLNAADASRYSSLHSEAPMPRRYFRHVALPGIGAGERAHSRPGECSAKIILTASAKRPSSLGRRDMAFIILRDGRHSRAVSGYQYRYALGIGRDAMSFARLHFDARCRGACRGATFLDITTISTPMHTLAPF